MHRRRPMLRRRKSTRAIARPGRPGPIVSLTRQTTFANPASLSSMSAPFARYTSALTPFPPILECDLLYSAQLSITGTTSIANSGTAQVFRLNSLFDPDLTNAGHQPRYYDQLTNVYSIYRVLSVAFEVEFYHPTTTTMWVGAAITNSRDSYSLTTATINNVRESDGSWVQPMRGDDTPLVLRATKNIWDAEGISYAHWLGNDNYEALIGANPGQSPTLQLCCGDTAAPVSVSSMYLTIKMIFRCKMWGRNTPSGS